MKIGKLFRLTPEVDRKLATETRNALVATLFGSPASLAIGASAGTAVAAWVAFRVSDPWLTAIALLIALVGTARVGHLASAKSRIAENRTGSLDETIYEVGAWAFSGLLGLLTLLVFVRTNITELHLLVGCTTTGYAAGIAARNAGRPVIATGQMFLAAAPATLCAGSLGRPTYMLLGAVNLLFMLALRDIIRKTYAAVFNAMSTARRRQEALQESEHLSRSIIEASPDSISILDAEGNVLFANRAALQAYGIDDEAVLLGRPWGNRLSAESRARRDAAFDAARAGQVGRVTLSLLSSAGKLRWYESLVSPLAPSASSGNRFMVMSRDITDQKAIETQVRWSAGHDSLTKLPNRALFQHQLDTSIQIDGAVRFSLLLLDIDNFKQVNDTLGHDAGDALLCAAADRIRSTVRNSDFVARLGGDEFAVILTDMDSEGSVRTVAGKILERLREPWIHDGRVRDCRASIGASIFSKHGLEASTLLKNADIALYHAKLNGRGQMAVFRAGMRAEMRKRSSMLDLARTAIDEDRIRPYYQPKVDLASGQVSGFEALLRWRHPTRGTQPPASIAAAFDDLELATELTQQMITKALTDMCLWLDQGVRFGHVAFNASAADFKQIGFAENLIERLNRAGIPPACVQVEVTETVFLGRGADYVEKALNMLSAHGIKIALDDFGTGYASLSHLKQFPVDIVKIDRSFVRDIQSGEDNGAIIKAVLNLGRSLELDVVAEGIETRSQLAYLISHGCKTGQGYYFGKAVPAGRVPSIVRDLRQLRAA